MEKDDGGAYPDGYSTQVITGMIALPVRDPTCTGRSWRDYVDRGR